ncbi:hypothetical protein BDF14DRAFT_1878438 [Spinellus fusiger]|nr:hypothetical protein BDF14DRAFT_1878438 [Spinellus fusiger]
MSPTATYEKDSGKGIGFKEFKLDPFQIYEVDSTPAPHRLREARRSFLLYLQPSPSTALHTSLLRFQEHSYASIGPNQTHNTLSHIPLFNRIDIERGSQFDTKWQGVDDLLAAINEEITLHKESLSVPQFAGYETHEKPIRSLTMKVSLSSSWHKMLNAIESRLPGKCTPQAANRIQLGYNVLNSLSCMTVNKLLEMAKQDINVDEWVLSGGSWEIRLYEIMVESGVVGVQHQLSQVKSWKIQHEDERVLPSLIPSSLRVRLSVFLARIRYQDK